MAIATIAKALVSKESALMSKPCLCGSRNAEKSAYVQCLALANTLTDFQLLVPFFV